MKGKRTNLLFCFINDIEFNFHVAIWVSGGVVSSMGTDTAQRCHPQQPVALSLDH